MKLSVYSVLCLFLDNITQPLILLNSTTGISVLSLKSANNISNTGVYTCSSKNLITNDIKVQVGAVAINAT